MYLYKHSLGSVRYQLANQVDKMTCSVDISQLHHQPPQTGMMSSLVEGYSVREEDVWAPQHDLPLNKADQVLSLLNVQIVGNRYSCRYYSSRKPIGHLVPIDHIDTLPP